MKSVTLLLCMALSSSNEWTNEWTIEMNKEWMNDDEWRVKLHYCRWMNEWRVNKWLKYEMIEEWNEWMTEVWNEWRVNK